MRGARRFPAAACSASASLPGGPFPRRWSPNDRSRATATCSSRRNRHVPRRVDRSGRRDPDAADEASCSDTDFVREPGAGTRPPEGAARNLPGLRLRRGGGRRAMPTARTWGRIRRAGETWPPVSRGESGIGARRRGALCKSYTDATRSARCRFEAKVQICWRSTLARARRGPHGDGCSAVLEAPVSAPRRAFAKSALVRSTFGGLRGAGGWSGSRGADARATMSTSRRGSGRHASTSAVREAGGRVGASMPGGEMT